MILSNAILEIVGNGQHTVATARCGMRSSSDLVVMLSLSTHGAGRGRKALLLSRPCGQTDYKHLILHIRLCGQTDYKHLMLYISVYLSHTMQRWKR